MKIIRFDIKQKAVIHSIKYKKGDELNGIVLKRAKTIRYPVIVTEFEGQAELEDGENYHINDVILYDNGQQFVVGKKDGNIVSLLLLSLTSSQFAFKEQGKTVLVLSMFCEVAL